MDSEQVLSLAQQRMAEAYGPVSIVVPWAQILAILLSVLSGCIKPPAGLTVAQVQANAKRFLTKVQYMRRAHAVGIFGDMAERTWGAALTVLASASADEVTALIAAASESE